MARLRSVTGSAAVVLLALGTCRCDTFRYYDVMRTRVEECDVLPQGELCDETDGFAPPVLEVWAVERRGDEVRVYVDGEVWVANPQDADRDVDFITADKLEVSIREPGPCTTTTTRSFDLIATFEALVGEIDERAVLTGPDGCGTTPSGLRTRARLDGAVAGAP